MKKRLFSNGHDIIKPISVEPIYNIYHKTYTLRSNPMFLTIWTLNLKNSATFRKFNK